MPLLEITEGDFLKGQHFVLDPGHAITIGRNKKNRIVLPDGYVSRNHAEIRHNDNECLLVDLDSTYGTAVNEQKVTEPYLLGDGDRIRIGTSELTFWVAPDWQEEYSDIAQSTIAPHFPKPEEAEATAKPPSGDQTLVSAPAQTPVSAVLFTDQMMELKKEVYFQLLEALNRDRQDTTQPADDAERKRIKEALDNIMKDDVLSRLPADLDPEVFYQALLEELLEFGPISPLLKDKDVDEIMVNNVDHIYIRRAGKLKRSKIRFIDEEHLRNIAQRLVEPLGYRIDESNPLFDARLSDGTRVSLTTPPITPDGIHMTIQKRSEKKLSIDELVNLESLSPDMAAFLREAVRAHQNIVVSGRVGSGNTTLLNALAQCIPEHERIVTIERAAELQLAHVNIVRMEARSKNTEDGLSIRDLIVHALRMCPDRLVVGECRGAETLDLLQAMNSGGDGSLTAVRANSPRDTLSRLESMVMMGGLDLPSNAIREQLASAIDFVVHQEQLPDGTRRVVNISEISGRDEDAILLSDVFKFQPAGASENGGKRGEFKAMGIIPRFIDELKEKDDLRIDSGIFQCTNAQ